MVKNEDGVAAIEFAILALPFFVIIFFLIEVSVGFMAQVTLENAVQRTSRDIRIGAAQTLDEGELRRLICTNLVGLYDCQELRMSLRTYESFQELASAMDGEAVTNLVDAPASDKIMALSVGYDWPVITPVLHAWIADTSDGTRAIAAQTIFRNEPF